jgi:hypothetical protein
VAVRTMLCQSQVEPQRNHIGTIDATEMEILSKMNELIIYNFDADTISVVRRRVSFLTLITLSPFPLTMNKAEQTGTPPQRKTRTATINRNIQIKQ